MMSDTPRPPADPAASMSLLTQVLMNPLDAGYYAYGKHSAQSSTWHKVAVLVASISLGIAGYAAVHSLRSPVNVDVSDSLAERARQRADTLAGLEIEISQMRAKVANVAGPEVSHALGDDKGLQISTSTIPLRGEGLRVTINEARPSGVDAERRNRGRVRDHDVRMVVNALWSAGAEAISVNGIRIGPGSFIRTAGQSILVNISPIQPPYVIEAIGDAPAMSVALIQGETGDYLSSIESAHGISLQPQAVSELLLPAVEQRALRYTLIQEDTP